MTSPDLEPWERVGRFYAKARVQAGFKSRDALAAAAKISTRTVADLERGRRPGYSERVLMAAQRVVGWADASIDSVLAGGEPILLSEQAQDYKLIPVLVPAKLAGQFMGPTLAVPADATPEEIAAAQDEVIEQMRRIVEEHDTEKRDRQ